MRLTEASAHEAECHVQDLRIDGVLHEVSTRQPEIKHLVQGYSGAILILVRNVGRDTRLAGDFLGESPEFLGINVKWIVSLKQYFRHTAKYRRPECGGRRAVRLKQDVTLSDIERRLEYQAGLAKTRPDPAGISRLNAAIELIRI